ncbi:MAG: hypothetical protein FWG11_08830, partial [Promicromonosporaceae bacterium]|nr:hypothetical protein [Promicromonosporaceae bacterium]
ETGEWVPVQVAGYSALICAKSHKVGERLAGARSGERTRGKPNPKDGSDMWRLLAASDPDEVAATTKSLTERPVTSAAARKGVEYLREIVSSRELHQMSRREFQDYLSSGEIDDVIDTWTARYFKALDT